MRALERLLRLTGVELDKFRSKSVTWATWVLLFVFPIAVECGLVLWVSKDEAVLPEVTHLLFAGEALLVIALTNTVISVMTLGNDYELGTVRVFLSQGVERYQFILSKVLATVVLAFANGLSYLSGGLLAAVVAHIALSDVPLREAAGVGLLWSALKAAGVIGLTGFVFAGVVMLALVLGRNAWIGMLAGLGSFLVDFFFLTLGIISTDASRYSITYHAFSLLESCFRSNLGLRTSGALAEHGLREPGQALVVLLLQGCGLTLVAIFLFRRQDLMARN